jgi:hypothetical protein
VIVAEAQFDIVRWIGPLMYPDKRQRLKTEVKTLRAMKPQEQYKFPEGIYKKRKSFGLSAAFDDSFQQFVSSDTADVGAVHAKLAALGAPASCHVIAPGYDYYEKLPLRQALESAMSHDDGQEAVIMCLPGQLLYCQDQYSQAAIVSRPQAATT